MQAQKVGSLYYELFLDPTHYNEQLLAAEKRAQRINQAIKQPRIKNIQPEFNSQPITPQVDDKQLTDLNKHLDLKIEHLNQVRGYYASNPIVTKAVTDKASINNASKELESKLKNKEINIDVKISTSRTIDLNPFKSVGNAAKGIIAGALEGVGQEISKNLGKGISQGIERIVSPIIGSTELLGEKMGESVANKFGEQTLKLESKAGALFRDLSKNDEFSKQNRRVFKGVAEFLENRGLTSSLKESVQETLGTQNVSVEQAYQERLRAERNQQRMPKLPKQPRVKQSSQSKELDSYQQLVSDVAELSGVQFDLTKVPKININEMSGRAMASYDSATNTINLTKDLAEKIQARQELTEKELNTLIHELRHAAQFKFGEDLSGKGIDLITPEKGEAKQLRRRIEQSVASQPVEQRAKARALEADAYVFAERATPQILQRNQKNKAVSDFENQLGFAGGKADTLIVQAQIAAIKQAKQLAATSTVDVQEEFKDLISETESYAARLSPLLEQASNLNILSADEIKQLQLDISQQLKQEFENISQSVEDFKNKIAYKSDVGLQMEARLQQANKADDLVPIAQALGIKSPQKLKKAELVGQIKETGNFDLIKKLLPAGANASTEVRQNIDALKGFAPEDLSTIFKESYSELSKLSKSNLSGGQLVDLSSEIEKEYKTIIGLLSSGLSEDANKVLQNAKLNIARLRKQTINQIVQEYNQPVKTQQNQQQSVSSGELFAFEDIAAELETLRASAVERFKQIGIAVQQAKQSFSNKQNQNIGQQSLESADESLQEISQAVLNNQSSKVNNASQEIEQYVNEVFESFNELFENRLKEYERVLSQASEKLNNLDIGELPEVDINKQNEQAKFLNRLEREGMIENAGLLQMPKSSVNKQSGLKTFVDGLSKEFNIAVSDVFDGFKDTIRRQAVTINREIPALNADLLSSSAAYQMQGDNEQSQGLLQYKQQLEEIQAKMLPLLNKPLVALNPEDADQLNKLNQQGLDLFDTFNRDIPKESGIFAFLSSLNIGTEQLEGFIGVLGKLGVAFAVFKILSAFTPQILEFAKAASEAAIEMESLATSLDFTTGNSEKALATLADQADRLKFNLRDGIEQYSKLAASMQNTPLEGGVGERIFERFQTAFGARNLNREQRSGAMLAIQQLIDKQVVSMEELRGQLSERLPGAFAAAARSRGQSASEFSKSVASGEVESNQFVEQFSLQLQAESMVGFNKSTQTVAASLTDLENQIYKVQVAAGQGLLPVQKLGVDAAVIALKFLADNIENIQKLIQLLAVYAGVKAANAFLLLGKVALSSAVSFVQMNGAIGATHLILGSLKAAAMAILPLLGKLAILAAIADVFTLFSNTSKNLSGDIQDFVKNTKQSLEQYKQALAEARNNTTDFATNLPKSIGDIKADSSFLEETILGGLLPKDWARGLEKAAADFDQGLRNFMPFLYGDDDSWNSQIKTKAQKRVEDTVNGINELVQAGNQRIKDVQSQMSSGSELGQVRDIDRQIERTSARRRGLQVSNPDDREGLRALQAEEKDLFKQRERAAKPIAILQAGLAADIEQLKKSLSQVDELAASRQIDQKSYTETTTKLKEQLDAAQKAQDELNKSLRSSLTPLELFERSFERIVARLEDTNRAVQGASNKLRTSVLNEELAGGISQEQSQALLDDVGIKAQQRQLEATLKTVKELRAELENQDYQTILTDRGLNPNQVGAAETKALAERESNPREKAVLERLSQLKEQELQVSDLEAQIAESRANVQRRLVDLTKQVIDFYRNIDRQAQLNAIEMQQMARQINATKQQNKLRKALLDGYDTIVSQFVDNIIQSIDDFNQVNNRASEAQTQLLQNRFSQQDTERTAVDLKRQIPPVEVALDFSSIPNDSNVARLQSEIDNAIGGSSRLGTEINRSTEGAFGLQKQLNENIKPIEEANKKLLDTSDSLIKADDAANKLNQTNQQIQGSTKSWVDYLMEAPSKLGGLGEFFNSLYAKVGELWEQTKQWLKGLTQIPEKLGEIGQNISGVASGFVENVQQNGIVEAGKNFLSSNFGIGAKEYSIASPSTTQSLTQVLRGSVSQGQSFFGARPRRNGTHFGIDFDSTEGLGGGSQFQSMFPGKVTNLRQWGNGFRDRVGGEESNAIRVESKLPRGLGTFTTDYGHYERPSAKVREGQFIDAGQLLGKLAENDTGSQGGHLDVKIRVPSNVANAFKSKAPAGNSGMFFVDVKEFMNWYQRQLGLFDKNGGGGGIRIPAQEVINSSSQRLQQSNTRSNRRASTPQSTQQPVTMNVRRGGNDLSPQELAKLTPLGQHLYQFRNNPYVLAASDAVARAEGTDFRRNSKNYGYGMLIGNSQVNDLSSHPFVGTGRAIRHNSTASGRYQMMNFNFDRAAAQKQFGRNARADLNDVFKGDRAPSFSPAVQDLYFIYSLQKRGVLDEVLKGDLSGAFGKSGINSLAAHYASLENKNGQGYYRGQKTPEGMRSETIPFSQSRARFYKAVAGNQRQAPSSSTINPMQAVRNQRQTPSTPSINPVQAVRNNIVPTRRASNQALRQTIDKGLEISQQQNQQRDALIQQQAQADAERQRQEATRRTNQAIKQFERSRRDQGDQLNQSRREITDFGADAVRNPSPRQRQITESTQLQRRIQDARKERERQIEDRRAQSNQAREALSSGALEGNPLSPEITKQLQQSIKENERAIPELERQLKEINRIGNEYEKDLTRVANREERLRRQSATFETRQGDIQQLQQRAEAVQQLQQSSPLDVRLFDLPKLQEEIELKQAALDLDRQIAEEENKLFRFDINQGEYDKRIQQLQAENQQRVENAKVRRLQAEAELQLQKAQRDLEVRQQFAGFRQEELQNQLTLRNTGKGGANPLEIQRQLAESQLDMDSAQKELEIRSNRNRTPEEREQLIDGLQRSQRGRQNVIDAEFERNQEDNQIAARDLFDKSNMDVVAAQASQFKVFGQDNRARTLEKGLVIKQQQVSFGNQLKELERLAATNEEVAKSADLIRANYEELNKIKLDEIEQQFNEFMPVIQEMKGATQGLFADLLSGSEDALANFGKRILDYFTQLAAQMLTNDLFGAIGGMFGNNKQTPQLGGGGGGMFDLLGGLLGGLFYDGGVVPNYASGYNPLSEALKKEHAQTGKRAYVAVLSEGERVLNVRETKKFHEMGGDKILRMADGGIAGGAIPAISFNGGSGDVNVNNSINIQGNADNMNVPLFRQVLDGRIREIIRDEQRPGRSLNKKRRQ